MLRHTEINTDIVTWTRLLTRAAPTIGPHIDATASPMAITQEQSSERGKNNKQPPSSYESPPSSPLTSTSQSGESTPKSPITPVSFSLFDQSGGRARDDRKDGLKDGSLPMNGELPPPIPLSEEDLISGIHPSGQNEPIIPPPREFLGGSVSSSEDLDLRRSSVGSLQSPHHSTMTSSSVGGHPPNYAYPESSWNRARSPPNSSQAPPTQRMTSSGQQGHMVRGRTDGISISNNFESLGRIGPRARVEADAGGGSTICSNSGIGVDAVDGGNLLLQLYWQQRAVQTNSRPEHKVCLCGCGLVGVV